MYAHNLFIKMSYTYGSSLSCIDQSDTVINKPTHRRSRERFRGNKMAGDRKAAVMHTRQCTSPCVCVCLYIRAP